jgi:hypothetical protein
MAERHILPPLSLSLSLSLSSALLHTRDRIFTSLNYLLQLQPLVPAVGTEVLSQACVCVIRYHLVGGVRVPNRLVTRLSPASPVFPAKERLSREAGQKEKREKAPGRNLKDPRTSSWPNEFQSPFKASRSVRYSSRRASRRMRRFANLRRG